MLSVSRRKLHTRSMSGRQRAGETLCSVNKIWTTQLVSLLFRAGSPDFNSWYLIKSVGKSPKVAYNLLLSTTHSQIFARFVVFKEIKIECGDSQPSLGIRVGQTSTRLGWRINAFPSADRKQLLFFDTICPICMYLNSGRCRMTTK